MNVLQGVLIEMPPIPKALRLTSVASNQLGRALGLHLMLRVPPHSVISRVFANLEDFTSAESATENLGDWKRSNGSTLARRKVFVEARKLGDNVLALIQGKKVGR